jgi:hypothetical protein
MPVDLHIHEVIPDVRIDMCEKGCHNRESEQTPVSTLKPDFPEC